MSIKTGNGHPLLCFENVLLFQLQIRNWDGMGIRRLLFQPLSQCVRPSLPWPNYSYSFFVAFTDVLEMVWMMRWLLVAQSSIWKREEEKGVYPVGRSTSTCMQTGTHGGEFSARTVFPVSQPKWKGANDLFVIERNKSGNLESVLLSIRDVPVLSSLKLWWFICSRSMLYLIPNSQCSIFN